MNRHFYRVQVPAYNRSGEYLVETAIPFHAISHYVKRPRFIEQGDGSYKEVGIKVTIYLLVTIGSETGRESDHVILEDRYANEFLRQVEEDESAYAQQRKREAPSEDAQFIPDSQPFARIR